MYGKVKIELLGTLENLRLIRNLTRSFLENFKIKEREILVLLTVVDELATNVVEHAYNYKEKSLSLYLKRSGDEVELIVEDYGKEHDPKKKSKSEGGMGLKIVKGLVDKLEIIKSQKGKQFKIKKKVQEAECGY